MEIGITIGGFDTTTETPAEFARKVEAAGFDALSLGEHVHSVGNLEQHPPSRYELFISLALAAAATTTLNVSSGIMQLGMRDPIATAKSAATIAALSGDRIQLVMATGSVPGELRNHGTDPERARDVLHDRLAGIRALFASDPASYHGEFVNFDDASLGPRQGDRVNVPILLGASFEGINERVAQYGDGWAMWPRHETDIEHVRQFRADNPGKLIFVLGLETAEQIAAYRDAGADRVYLGLWDLTPAAVDGQLTALKKIVDSVS